jgi:serine/threonine-protein kinase
MGCLYQAFGPNRGDVVCKVVKHNPHSGTNEGILTVVAQGSPHLVSANDFNKLIKKDGKLVETDRHSTEISKPTEWDHFLIMERIRGKNLTELMAMYPDNKLPVELALEIIRQAAEGLKHLHELGIVHRDVKLENIMKEDGENGIVKITDLGLAEIFEESAPKGNLLFGTLGYMSPEQIDGKQLDQRSDIFSLGIVLFEMIAGKHPFASDISVERAMKIRTKTPEYIALPLNTPVKLVAILKKMLEKEPENRYQNCDDFMRDLAAV